jgi:hypothetical protein
LVGNHAYYFGMGDLLREWNDLDAAEHHLEQGMDPVSEIPLLRSGAARRVQLEQLPGYAPDRKPDEGVYEHLKRVELKNLCCQSLSELRVELRKAKERLRHKRDIILGCIRQPGFEV